jgi:hypothetical protein
MYIVVAVVRFLLALGVTFGILISASDILQLGATYLVLIVCMALLLYSVHHILQGIKDIKRKTFRSKIFTIYSIVIALSILYLTGSPLTNAQVEKDSVYLFIL